MCSNEAKYSFSVDEANPDLRNLRNVVLKEHDEIHDFLENKLFLINGIKVQN